MSAITASATSSGLSAIAQLLANSANTVTAVASQTSQSGSSAPATASSNPSDSLDLSDHAKATLAQAQQQQIAADNLQAFLQSARNPNGAGNSSSPSQTSDDVTKIFDQLTGQAQQGSAPAPGQSLDDFLSNRVSTLESSNKLPGGSIGGFAQTLQNVVANAPSNPQQVAAWYQSIEAQQVVSGAQFRPQDNPGLAEALANHSVTFLSASDIPDLNFRNTITIQGGEGGVSTNNTYNYNTNAAIFSDPNTSYDVLADGIVLSWKTPSPPAAGTPS